ncbi:hypothetical protein LguiB_016692 [Lonicera macranthoides]
MSLLFELLETYMQAAFSKRIHYGKFMVEIKFSMSPEDYESAIRAQHHHCAKKMESILNSIPACSYSYQRNRCAKQECCCLYTFNEIEGDSVAMAESVAVTHTAYAHSDTVWLVRDLKSSLQEVWGSSSKVWT